MTDALLADLRALARELLIVSAELIRASYDDDGERIATALGRGSLAITAKCDHLYNLIAKHETEPDVSERDGLAQAAAWVAETIGYPVETSTPDAPMPDGLWEALVDHVHADKSGRWHGNELDRDEVAAWLAEEAGRGSGRPAP